MADTRPDTPTGTLSVAVLGTGTMGSGMAANLARAGLDVRVWNRSRERAEPLAAAGCAVHDTAAAAVEGADVVLTMLWDADSVLQAITSAAAALRPGTVWVQSTTVGVAGERRMAALAAEHDLVYVDAPVLGTKQPAADGQLVVLATAPEAARPGLAPVFDAIGSRTVWVGGPGGASRLKLVVNQWVLTVLDGVAEALTLAGGLGLDPALFLEAVRGGATDAPYVQLKGRGMLDGNFEPAFTLSGALKDAELIEAATIDAGVDPGLISLLAEHLRRAVAGTDGGLDMSAVYLAHRPGVQPGPR